MILHSVENQDVTAVFLLLLYMTFAFIYTFSLQPLNYVNYI